MITTQKVVAVLRKAGLTISKFGGTITRGYRTQLMGDFVRVEYTDGSYGNDTPEQWGAALEKARAALLAAGLTVQTFPSRAEYHDGWLEVS